MLLIKSGRFPVRSGHSRLLRLLRINWDNFHFRWLEIKHYRDMDEQLKHVSQERYIWPSLIKIVWAIRNFRKLDRPGQPIYYRPLWGIFTHFGSELIPKNNSLKNRNLYIFRFFLNNDLMGLIIFFFKIKVVSKSTVILSNSNHLIVFVWVFHSAFLTDVNIFKRKN